MDAFTRQPDEFGEQPHSSEQAATPAPDAPDGTGAMDGTAPLPRVSRPSRDALTSDLGTGSGGTARVVQIVAGDYLLTVNPVDGTEVVGCPPEAMRIPERRTPAERAEWMAAARPGETAGPRGPALPLLERDEERERLVRLLGRGRSVRVTGPSGSGRSVLLDAVAKACADLAPDGVLRLSGYRRTAADLLHDLFALVYRADGYRPDRPRLLELLRDVGAVVILDDLEFGGPALEELLAAAPECAFLIAATPDVAAPSPDSHIEEVFLPGLTRVACLELLERAVQRPLDEDETAWAADLWFESEGLPLRFVQAGALLRQCDALRTPDEADWDDSVWGSDTPPAPGADDLDDEPFDAPRARQAPLPSLAESAAPADLLASRLSEAARRSLAFAVALEGECPHQSHLPALVGDTHADAALGEIAACGLAMPVAAHYRLAAGVRQQLAVGRATGDDDAAAKAHTAAQHYAWWTGHRSVTPQRVAAEAETILAAMGACRDGGHHSSAVLLARSATPVFAAALHWGAWERALRIGQEAARLAGEVAEEAYFHHELGVLALCTGNLQRARAELEASIALRGALADRQGTLVGRRTLALVNDRSGRRAEPSSPAGMEIPTTGADASTSPLNIPALIKQQPDEPPATVISRRLEEKPSTRRIAFTGSRRNLAAAGAGAVLAAVVGTLLTIGTSADGHDTNTPMNVKPAESAQPDTPYDGIPADQPSSGSPTSPHPSKSASTSPGSTSPSPVTSGSPSAGTGTGRPSTRPTTTSPRPSTSPPKPTKTPSPSSTPSPTDTTSPSPSPTPSSSSGTTASGSTGSTAPTSTASSGSSSPSATGSAPIA